MEMMLRIFHKFLWIINPICCLLKNESQMV
mgnify:FL=1